MRNSWQKEDDASGAVERQAQPNLSRAEGAGRTGAGDVQGGDFRKYAEEEAAFSDYLALLGGIAREEASCGWLKDCLRSCERR